MKIRDILRFSDLMVVLSSGRIKQTNCTHCRHGFAPIKSIVEHAIARQIERPIFIYWGAKTKPTFTKITYQNNGPKRTLDQIHSCTFAPEPNDAWDGHTGFVHQVVSGRLPRIYLAIRYACGSPARLRPAKLTSLITVSYQKRNLFGCLQLCGELINAPKRSL